MATMTQGQAPFSGKHIDFFRPINVHTLKDAYAFLVAELSVMLGSSVGGGGGHGGRGGPSRPTVVASSLPAASSTSGAFPPATASIRLEDSISEAMDDLDLGGGGGEVNGGTSSTGMPGERWPAG